MSLQPQQPIPRVPEQTARIARAAFPKGSPYLTLRDRLGTIFAPISSQGTTYCGYWQRSTTLSCADCVPIARFARVLTEPTHARSSKQHPSERPPRTRPVSVTT